MQCLVKWNRFGDCSARRRRGHWGRQLTEAAAAADGTTALMLLPPSVLLKGPNTWKSHGYGPSGKDGSTSAHDLHGPHGDCRWLPTRSHSAWECRDTVSCWWCESLDGVHSNSVQWWLCRLSAPKSLLTPCTDCILEPCHLTIPHFSFFCTAHGLLVSYAHGHVEKCYQWAVWQPWCMQSSFVTGTRSRSGYSPSWHRCWQWTEHTCSVWVFPIALFIVIHPLLGNSRNGHARNIRRNVGRCIFFSVRAKIL
jgi:hypothetical protein